MPVPVCSRNEDLDFGHVETEMPPMHLQDHCIMMYRLFTAQRGMGAEIPNRVPGVGLHPL